jgi:hypothetical protein
LPSLNLANELISFSSFQCDRTKRAHHRMSPSSANTCCRKPASYRLTLVSDLSRQPRFHAIVPPIYLYRLRTVNDRHCPSFCRCILDNPNQFSRHVTRSLPRRSNVRPVYGTVEKELRRKKKHVDCRERPLLVLNVKLIRKLHPCNKLGSETDWESPSKNLLLLTRSSTAPASPLLGPGVFCRVWQKTPFWIGLLGNGVFGCSRESATASATIEQLLQHLDHLLYQIIIGYIQIVL